MSNSLRILFAGTPEFAAHHLNSLIHSSPHNVIGVLTQPDRPSGRGNKLAISAVKYVAKQHNLMIFQPCAMNMFAVQNLLHLNIDVIVVVAYGVILPQAILNMPKFGCINVHGSLLPRWRGAAPIQRALWANDKQTGITIIKMDENLDAGPILHQAICTIEPHDTSAALYKKLEKIGSRSLLITLAQIASDKIVAKPQKEACVTYAKKISKAEARLDWRLSALQLECCVRAFNPWPVSYFSFEGQNIKVWQASIDAKTLYSQPPGTLLSVDKTGLHVATGKGILILKSLQLAGTKVMAVQDFLNSRRQWLCPGLLLS
ncbi:methionyl-tRNA formyltransferase [Candidatus Curculioniphilus buchneri]|uniref:methionyl-tRNA formyltransferase n=1 Tax=Candidatus Curculioniphilus buchneri TaxID=690594 RepID=UPI00376EEBA3